MPSSDDKFAEAMTRRLMASSSVEIFNAYLPQIKDLYLPVEKNAEYGIPFDPAHNIRYFNITKWVTDKKENNLEKLGIKTIQEESKTSEYLDTGLSYYDISRNYILLNV